jgi:hypothetical protein
LETISNTTWLQNQDNSNPIPRWFNATGRDLQYSNGSNRSYWPCCSFTLAAVNS